MITVTQLSRNYPSIWKKTFPFLNRLVRTCNLQKKTFDDGIYSKSEPSRRALINETGFYFYKEMLEKRINKVSNLTQEDILKVTNFSFHYIINLDFNPDQLLPLDQDEIKESKLIAENLFNYFIHNEKGKKIIIFPHFSGCGFVSECFGDILAGTTLYEVKSGERDFRIADLKQIITYLTLNHSSHKNTINHIGLVNPRLGSYIVLSVKDAIELASGQSTVDSFNELMNFLDSPDDFR